MLIDEVNRRTYFLTIKCANEFVGGTTAIEEYHCQGLELAKNIFAYSVENDMSTREIFESYVRARGGSNLDTRAKLSQQILDGFGILNQIKEEVEKKVKKEVEPVLIPITPLPRTPRAVTPNNIYGTEGYQCSSNEANLSNSSYKKISCGNLINEIDDCFDITAIDTTSTNSLNANDRVLPPENESFSTLAKVEQNGSYIEYVEKRDGNSRY